MATEPEARVPREFYLGVEPPEPTRSRVGALMVELGDRSPLPHVTLKAPRGLGADLAWYPPVEAVVRRSPVLTVELGSPGTFAGRIMFLSVRSPGARALHQELLEAVPADQSDDERWFEGDQFVPHLTLARFSPRQPERLEAALAAADGLLPIEPFEAHEIVVFARGDAGPYRPWRRVALGQSRHGDHDDLR